MTSEERAATMDEPGAKRDHIFLSYRRDDASGSSDRLYDWLIIGFGKEHVFQDVASIGVGKWREKIDAALTQSAVCVAVIGKHWADVDNLVRLGDEDDMVRYELVTALNSRGTTMVPTLVEGAEVPKPKMLPAVLRALFEVWSARRVTREGWIDDVRRLIAEIAEAAGLEVGSDFEVWLRMFGDSRQRIAELEQKMQLQSCQAEAIRGTVDELTRKLAEAPAEKRPGLAAALAGLAEGDSAAAEKVFERDYAAKNRSARKERLNVATAARNVANLALLRDANKAERYYRKALALQPLHTGTAQLLGSTLVLQGDLKGARAAYAQSLKSALARKDTWGKIQAQNGLGDVFLKRGSLKEANRAYTDALRAAGRVRVSNATGIRWQPDVALSHERIGDVRVSLGELKEARSAYRKSMVIREGLIKQDASNTEWQIDLAVSCEKLGGLANVISVGNRRDYLLRGKEIVGGLKSAGKLSLNEGLTSRFDQKLAGLSKKG